MSNSLPFYCRVGNELATTKRQRKQCGDAHGNLTQRRDLRANQTGDSAYDGRDGCNSTGTSAMASPHAVTKIPTAAR